MCYDLNRSRITIMGDNQSGKTSLIFRWLKNMYQIIEDGAYQEDIYHKNVNFHNLLDDLIRESPERRDDKLMEHLLKNDDGFLIKDTDLRDYFLKINKRISESDLPEEVQHVKRHHRYEFEKKKLLMKRCATLDVEILDSQAIETADFSELTSAQIKQSDAFILCFDCTNRDSFNDLRTYQRRIERARGIDDKVPVIICCTKVDVMSERKVDLEDVQDFINKAGLSMANDYFEVSSKHDINTQALLNNTLLKIESYKFEERKRMHSSLSNENFGCSEKYNNEKLERDSRDKSSDEMEDSTSTSSGDRIMPGDKGELVEKKITSFGVSMSNFSKTRQNRTRTVTNAPDLSGTVDSDQKITTITTSTTSPDKKDTTCCVIC